jgi:NADH:ubiquinone oxidoreductase subunit K
MLILSGIMFMIGLSGIIWNRKNIIVILMSIELILLAVNMNFIKIVLTLLHSCFLWGDLCNV